MESIRDNKDNLGDFMVNKQNWNDGDILYAGSVNTNLLQLGGVNTTNNSTTTEAETELGSIVVTGGWTKAKLVTVTTGLFDTIRSSSTASTSIAVSSSALFKVYVSGGAFTSQYCIGSIDVPQASGYTAKVGGGDAVVTHSNNYTLVGNLEAPAGSYANNYCIRITSTISNGGNTGTSSASHHSTLAFMA
jgi:hypothetical protein